MRAVTKLNATWLLTLVSSAAMAGKAHQTATTQDADSAGSQQSPALSIVETEPSVDVDDVDSSTVVYPATFFEPYSPVSANDMLDRIPGVDVDGGGGGGRGLGTGGDLLINGQRIAGKDNSPRAQLSRIPAQEVLRIEIIRGTSGDLAVRGAGQVVNIVLTDVGSRASTSAELVARLNHDDLFETGAEISHSRQIGNFQALISALARPNYENRESRETQLNAAGLVVGSLFETNIRDQDIMELSGNTSYRTGSHRMQLNALYSDSGHPRRIRREFLEFGDNETVARTEAEAIANDHFNWEVGGDYEYSFANEHRLQVLFIVNDQTRDSVRERFAVTPTGGGAVPRDKNLYIESNQRTRERIVQGNYSFPLGVSQDLRMGLESADTRLDSSLFIGSSGGSAPASDRYGGLPPLRDISNPGTEVQEIRYEGFVFHNWTLSDRMTLESSVVYESSEISQSGVVNNSRRFNFVRPGVDYRFNLTESFQIRATIERDVSQLSFANFAATANNSDRDQDASAGNPELEPEQETRYELGFEYRLPNDNGVLNTRFFYRDIEDYIGRINATRDPAQPLSAVGNVGSAQRWGVFNEFSTRLSYFDLPDAIVSGELRVFDSSISDPFLGTDQRINRRGDASLAFRQDVTEYALNYGMEYNYPFHGGEYEIDITTVTRNDQQPSLNMFVSKVFFDDITVRLESDNTLGQSRCRERRRYDGTTINGNISEIEDSCSSRYRRLTLRVQTTF
ncbi:TonB-dependent receptor plug domain-containing protein [Pseudohongiella sp.]|uniref:TonB-dependent receptor plug domain-containing protein n=1 Tax=marine sediment metagenome TaxID=412755 RepID=A0A0F9W640_9ZZZZ|nr:TonB-dependent receptor [Pseudohongiella sp.]HDZ08174.1 TonB-dependent receptor [Pseudohongiella sp.]HEA63142.1 TonB-dependent receptor [Pseudohongiella sp.]